jgi:hypothetical protein
MTVTKVADFALALTSVVLAITVLVTRRRKTSTPAVAT